MADESGVLVLGDSPGGELSSTSRELLTAGRKAADDLGEELAIGLLGDTLDQPSQQAISYGADKVYAVTHPQLAQYQVDLYLAAMEALCRDVSPRVVLIGRTNEGRELAPRLAFRLGVGLAQDCLEISVDAGSKTLLANRPVYGATPSRWSDATTLLRSPPSVPKSTSPWTLTPQDRARLCLSRWSWTPPRLAAKWSTWWKKRPRE